MQLCLAPRAKTVFAFYFYNNLLCKNIHRIQDNTKKLRTIYVLDIFCKFKLNRQCNDNQTFWLLKVQKTPLRKDNVNHELQQHINIIYFRNKYITFFAFVLNNIVITTFFYKFQRIGKEIHNIMINWQAHIGWFLWTTYCMVFVVINK